MSSTEEKFARWRTLQVEQGLDFNTSLLNDRDFYNPNIQSRLLEVLGVSPDGSNFEKFLLKTETNDSVQTSKFSQNHSKYIKMLQESPNFDYVKVAEEQRSVWEQSQKPPTSQNSLGISKKHQIMHDRYYGAQSKKFSSSK